ncbi:SCO2521 family protein [Nocardia australiensis]|uniref:SCO2521 family protein n=1 Tax=Nocardia australiensis TaxID=2887191 RepID=UPI001D14170D|nr:SCO2521 family protein [Nocardia australiensis]
MATPLVALGEVRTCLVPASAALNRAEVDKLLALVPGRRVLWRARPVTLAASPTTAIGVDCDLLLDASGERTQQIVGTVASRAVVFGGRVLQSSVHTSVFRASERRRQTWSHYLSRVGVTELIGTIGDRGRVCEELTEGYLAGPATADTLDLGSISDRLLARIRADEQLDQDAPIQARTTRLRWTAQIGGTAGPALAMRLEDETVRSVRMIVRSVDDLPAAQRFCEDLAAHDWLLTSTDDAIDEADRYPSASQDQMDILAPVLAHLAHLWMPGAHTPASVRSLWKELQNDPGFTRQWTSKVGQLRDRINVATLDTLRHAKITTTDW